MVDLISNAEGSPKPYWLSSPLVLLVEMPLSPILVHGIVIIVTSSSVVLKPLKALRAQPFSFEVQLALIFVIAVFLEKVHELLLALWGKTILEVAVDLKIIPGTTLSDIVARTVLTGFVVPFLHTKLVEFTNCTVWTSE